MKSDEVVYVDPISTLRTNVIYKESGQVVEKEIRVGDEILSLGKEKYVVLVRCITKFKSVLAVVNYLRKSDVYAGNIYVSGILPGYEVAKMMEKEKVPQFPFTRNLSDESTLNLYDALTPNELGIHSDILRLHPALSEATTTDSMERLLSRFKEMVDERGSKEYMLLPEFAAKLGDMRPVFVKAYATYDGEDDNLALWARCLIEMGIINKSDLSPTAELMDIVDAYRHSKPLRPGGSVYQEIIYAAVSIYVIVAGKWLIGDMRDKFIAIQAAVFIGLFLNVWIANEVHPDLADEEMSVAATMIRLNQE